MASSSVLRRVALAALCVLTLTMTAACSGSSNEGAANNSQPPASPSSSSAATPFPQAQAQAAAEDALLQLSDFPAGWSTSEPEETGDEVTKFRQELASCLKVPSDTFLADDSPDTAHARTQDFNSPDESQRVSETVIIRTTERVSALMSALEDSSATECYGTMFNEYMQGVFEESDDPDVQQATLGTIEVGRVSFPNYGDETVVFRATIPFSVSGFDVSVYGDVVFIQNGNGVASLSFFDQSSPFDVSAMKKYAKLAALRLAAADMPAA